MVGTVLMVGSGVSVVVGVSMVVGASVLVVVAFVLVVAGAPPVTGVPTPAAGVPPVSVPIRSVARVTSSATGIVLAGETGRTGGVKSFASLWARSAEIGCGRAGGTPAFTVTLSRTPTGVARPTALPVTGSRR